MKEEKLSLYKKLGIKLTPQRLAILEYLENNREHPSAEDIYNALKDRFPSMSFATVYNTLEILIEKGLVKELGIDTHKRRYDPEVSLHHHFLCKRCGKILDVESKYDISIPENLKDCQISDFQIVFYGFCPSCK